MNNDQEQDRGEFAPCPLPDREQRIQDGDLMNVMRQEVIDMEAFVGSGKAVVPSPEEALEWQRRQQIRAENIQRAVDRITPPAGDIRALKHRIHELEGEVIGYKKIIANQDAMLERQTARIVDLQKHIENFDGDLK